MVLQRETVKNTLTGFQFLYIPLFQQIRSVKSDNLLFLLTKPGIRFSFGDEP